MKTVISFMIYSKLIRKAFQNSKWESIFNVLFYFNKDARASYDVNGNDPDPTPRYDATNENKSVHSLCDPIYSRTVL